MKPPSKLKILFVCLGNICRSPMAEFVFRRMVEEARLAHLVEVASAATSDEEEGNPVYPPARRMLAEHGLRCDGKRACQMTHAMYDAADYVIAMDRQNIRNIQRMTGSDGTGKLYLLKDFAEGMGGGHEIADPWYTRNFDLAWKEINEGCSAFLSYLQSNEVHRLTTTSNEKDE